MNCKNQPVSTKIVLRNINNECRICLENNDKELIYPCKCKFPVHKECLKLWLESDNNSNPNKCEICKTNYNSSFVIIINRNNNSNLNTNNLNNDLNNNLYNGIQNNNQNNIISLHINEEIIRKKHCHVTLIFIFISMDVYFFYYYINYKNLNLEYLMCLILINFIFFCLFGITNYFIRNHGRFIRNNNIFSPIV